MADDQGNLYNGKLLYNKQMKLNVDLPRVSEAQTVELYQPTFAEDGSYELKKIHAIKLDPTILKSDVQYVPGVGRATVKQIYRGGDANKKVDMVILGDGYTSAERGKFDRQARDIVSKFFQVQPFKEYKSYFNIYQVSKDSRQSGATKGYDRRDTAYGCYYSCNSLRRLICCDQNKEDQVLNYNYMPNRQPLAKAEMIFVLVNDNEYGGSGGRIATASTNQASLNLVLHEIGHSFGKLADEYDTGGYACDYSRYSQANIDSGYRNRQNVKWAKWIGQNDGNGGRVDVVMGACYSTLFRSSQDSKMKTLSKNFNPVCVEEFVRRIYRAAPAFTKVNPSTSKTVRCSSGCTTRFSVQVQKPATHSLKLQWTVDRRSKGNRKRVSLDLRAMGNGRHTVSVTASDRTPMVRSDPYKRLSDTKTWTVDVSGNQATIYVS